MLIRSSEKGCLMCSAGGHWSPKPASDPAGEGVGSMRSRNTGCWWYCAVNLNFPLSLENVVNRSPLGCPPPVIPGEAISL